MWTLIDAGVSMSYTHMMWERDDYGNRQTLMVMVWNSGDMTVTATETLCSGHRKEVKIDSTPRVYVTNDMEITELFCKTLNGGDW